MATQEIPIYRYTLELKDDQPRQVDAMQYQLSGTWLVFDSVDGTVLTIREERVLAVARGAQVNKQEVEQL